LSALPVYAPVPAETHPKNMRHTRLGRSYMTGSLMKWCGRRWTWEDVMRKVRKVWEVGTTFWGVRDNSIYASVLSNVISNRTYKSD
jgi:hypothetical protein